MLLPGLQLLDTAVMSLQTGKELARTKTAIVNPHDLSVIAYLLSGPHLDHEPSYLRTADIREMGSLGMIVDSNDEFIIPEDIVTQKDIYELEYVLEGKHVVDTHGKKMGKVADYVIDIDSFVIQQLIVRRPLLKSFGDDELLVHRSQVAEVNDTTIIIRTGEIKSEVKVNPSRHYVNPFRQASPQPESAHADID